MSLRKVVRKKNRQVQNPQIKKARALAAQIIKDVPPEGSPLTSEDVCRIYKFSHSKLYKMTSYGTIPFYRRPGGMGLYFYANQIDELIIRYSNSILD